MIPTLTYLPLAKVLPDLTPFFKLLTKQEAKQLGLQIGNTDMPIQQSTRADLILNVPPGINLEGTLFDFCRAANIIEFKSENDPLGLREYVLNDLRTNLVFLQRKDTNFDNILNVVVSSRRPDGFIAEAKARGIEFITTDDKPWLLRAKVGFQDVVIIVCRNMPLERRYYLWLLFAPTASNTWKNLIRKLYREDKAFLELARQLRPVEVDMITKETVAWLGKAPAQVQLWQLDTAGDTTHQLPPLITLTGS